MDMHRQRGEQLLTLDRLFDRAFARYEDRVAIRFGDQRLTYGDLDERTARLANAFRDLGLAADDRVGILMENRPEYVVAHVAAVRAGVTVVPLNSRLNDHQLRSLLRTADLDTLLVDGSFFDVVDEIQCETNELNHVIGHGTDASLPIGFHDFADVLDRSDPSPPQVANEPTDVAALYYTSGTTGEPKGVMHAHRPLVLNCYAHIRELDVRRDERMLLGTPLSHSAEPFARAGLAQGGTLVLKQGLDAAEVLATIDDRDVTWTYLVPTVISEMLKDPTIEEADTDSLETLAYGAAPMPKPILESAIERFGRIFVQFYGLTEVPNLITVLPKSEHEPGSDSALNSAGYPAQLVEVTLKELDAPWADEVGEIAVRSPYALVRYAGDHEAYDADEWLRTGDVGRIEDGMVYVLDRLQDVIVTEGRPVYSTVVENDIQRHPDVKQVAVIGVPADGSGDADRRRTDQRVKAVVVPADGESVEAADVREVCDGRTDGSVPHSVDVVGQLPETPYGKIDKKALRDPYW